MGEVVWLDEGIKEGEIGGLSGDYCFIQGRGGGWVVQCCCFNEHGLWEDHNTFVVIFTSVVVWSARQSVSDLILLSWFVLQCKVVVG